jgi:Na+/H+ antiporter NhaD/arsenite permease-like protein
MVCFAAAIAYIWATNRDKFKPIDTNLAKLFSVQLLLEKIRYNFLDTKIDKIFLTKGLVCLGLAILLFVTQTITGLSPGVVAMLVAMVLFVITRIDVEEMLEEIEWSTLLCFSPACSSWWGCWKKKASSNGSPTISSCAWGTTPT